MSNVNYDIEGGHPKQGELKSPWDGMMPSCDLYAEEYILGNIIDDAERGKDRMLIDELPFLREHHFAHGEHSLIYQTILVLRAKGEPCDIITIMNQLKEDDRIRQLPGGPAKLTELINATAWYDSERLIKYANLIIEHWRLRKFQELGVYLTASAYHTNIKDLREFFAEVEMKVLEITRAKTVDGHLMLGPGMETLYTDMAARKRSGQDSDEKTAWKRTGIPALDSLMIGIRPSTLTIIAARPRIGKSAFVLNNLAVRVAETENEDVAFIGLEMPNKETIERAVSCMGKIRNELIRSNNLSDDDNRRFTALMARAKSIPLHLLDQRTATIQDITAFAYKVRRMAEDNGRKLGLVVIDYLQLIKSSSINRNATRRDVVAEITRALKQLSGEMDVPIVALSQLNRNVEGRSGNEGRPRLSDLAESSTVEQDADNVIFLHRKPDSESPSATELIVAKQRGGNEGIVELTFRGEYSYFEEAGLGGKTSYPPLAQAPKETPTKNSTPWYERDSDE